MDDILGGTQRTGSKRAAYPRKDHGGLHALIGRALPYLCDSSSVANLHRLSELLGMTYAGCHKWVRPGHPHKIPAKRVERICELSADFAKSKDAPKGFVPVKKIDFLQFMF